MGRLLAACLHQGILDVVPQRVDFYEEWLHPDGLRDGSIGLAPITAVIGFLRTDREVYDRVVARAGTLAAEWTVASLPAMQRRIVGSLPRPLRARAAMRVAARIVREVSSASGASSRIRRGRVRLDVRASLFCAVRERPVMPLCGFYAAVAVETLRRFGLNGRARIDACRAMAAGSCVVLIELAGAESAADSAIAA